LGCDTGQIMAFLTARAGIPPLGQWN